MKSARHHYIPVYYLKEFTDEDDKFFVYDVLQGKLKSGKFSPKQIGFEWHRNTTEFNGIQTDELETIFYKHLDSYISRQYKEIIKANRTTVIQGADYFNLQHFALSLFIRNPLLDDVIRKKFKSSSADELGFRVQHKLTNERVSDIEQKILESDHFIEIYRSIWPSLELYNLPESQVKNFRLSFAPNSKHSICSDNPIIFNCESIPDNIFEQEFIIPVTSRITLLYTNNKISISRLEPEDRLKIHLLILKQANRFVVSNYKEYLQHLASISKQFDSKYLRDSIFEKLK